MIDELEVVRRLGAEDPDPGVRERVRDRVFAPRRRRPRWPFVLGPAGAVGLGVALVVVLAGGQPEGNFASPTAPPRTVSATPVEAPALFPKPDEYLYVRSRSTYLSCREGAQPRCQTQSTTVREVWMSETRASRLRLTPNPDGVRLTPNPDRLPTRLGRVSLFIGNQRFTHAELAAYRPTPRQLLDKLVRERPEGQGGDARSYPFTQITDALREVPMPVAARRALIGALPLVPGVAEDGDVTDSAGRPGVAFSRNAGGGIRETVIIDPARLVMLEETRGDRRGRLVGRATYLERAVTVDTERP